MPSDNDISLHHGMMAFISSKVPLRSEVLRELKYYAHKYKVFPVVVMLNPTVFDGFNIDRLSAYLESWAQQQVFTAKARQSKRPPEKYVYVWYWWCFHRVRVQPNKAVLPNNLMVYRFWVRLTIKRILNWENIRERIRECCVSRGTNPTSKIRLIMCRQEI